MRKLHLIDIENLVGVPVDRETSGKAGASGRLIDATLTVLNDYLMLSEHNPADGVAISCNYILGRRLCFEMPDIAHRFVLAPPGPDAADQCLSDFFFASAVERFDEVVVGSGDSHFLRVGSACRQNGLRLSVVSRRRSLSRALRSCADSVRFVRVPRHQISLVDLSDTRSTMLSMDGSRSAYHAEPIAV